MTTLSLSSSLTLSTVSTLQNNKFLATKASPIRLNLTPRSSFLGFKVIVESKELVIKNQRRGSRGCGIVCYSAPFSPHDLQFVCSVSSAVLMLVSGTSIQKSFLVPLFALQAPASVVSWVKGEYGIWSAFLALLVRLFFFIPGELELPFIALLLMIVAPYQIMDLRGRQEGIILSLVISAYLAFQHFSKAESFQKAFGQGSIIATLAIVCIVAVPCLLLI